MSEITTYMCQSSTLKERWELIFALRNSNVVYSAVCNRVVRHFRTIREEIHSIKKSLNHFTRPKKGQLTFDFNKRAMATKV